VSRRRRRAAEPPPAAAGGNAFPLDGVRPLAGRDKLRPPPAGAASPRPGPRATRRFTVHTDGSRVSGRADDVSRKLLAKLRSGGFPKEREIDLHGLASRAARSALERELAEAQEQGIRCVLVIHGRGARSPEGAVLREALPGWLQGPALADRVLAFASAPPDQGGQGATLVLLRRAREVSSAAP
jgi:DNA-nicking Smr family endonuclease